MRKVISIDIRRPSDRPGHWSRVDVWAIVRATVDVHWNQAEGGGSFTLTLHPPRPDPGSCQTSSGRSREILSIVSLLLASQFERTEFPDVPRTYLSDL
jgi:hypothetical protein